MRTTANDESGPPPIYSSVSSNTTSEPNDNNEFNLEKMTEPEIKKWLREKGYKVKELGNRRFELTRVIGRKTSSWKLYMHSVFDANTAEMEPLGITKNNKSVSKTLAKKENGKHKTITWTKHSLFKEKAKKIFMKMISNQ